LDKQEIGINPFLPAVDAYGRAIQNHNNLVFRATLHRRRLCHHSPTLPPCSHRHGHHHIRSASMPPSPPSQPSVLLELSPPPPPAKAVAPTDLPPELLPTQPYALPSAAVTPAPVMPAGAASLGFTPISSPPPQSLGLWKQLSTASASISAMQPFHWPIASHVATTTGDCCLWVLQPWWRHMLHCQGRKSESFLPVSMGTRRDICTRQDWKLQGICC
jgi:hypothetical protein